MKVLIVSRSFYPSIGGIETISMNLAGEFVKLGHEVSILTDPRPIAEEKRNRFPFKIVSSKKFFDWVAEFRRMDVAICMNVSAPALFASWISGTKLLIVHQNTLNQRTAYKRVVVPFFSRLLKSRLIHFFPNVACSKFVASKLPVPAKVIPNFYDDSVFKSGNRSRSSDFVFCGRLNEAKGVDVALSALGQVAKTVPDVRMTIVGDGPERGALEELAESLNLTNNVKFEGFVSGEALSTLLNDHSCMLVPSRWEEAFGIVALEGIACCDLVIARDIGGLPEAVGSCGEIVDGRVESWAKAMLQVATDRRAGHAIRTQPTEEIRKCHLAKHGRTGVALQYMEALQEVLSGVFLKSLER